MEIRVIDECQNLLPKWIDGSKCKHHCCHNVISTVQIDTLDAPLAVYVGICSILSFYNPPPIVYIYNYT